MAKRAYYGKQKININNTCWIDIRPHVCTCMYIYYACARANAHNYTRTRTHARTGTRLASTLPQRLYYWRRRIWEQTFSFPYRLYIHITRYLDTAVLPILMLKDSTRHRCFPDSPLHINIAFICYPAIIIFSNTNYVSDYRIDWSENMSVLHVHWSSK